MNVHVGLGSPAFLGLETLSIDSGSGAPIMNVVAPKTKKLSERIREVLDTLADALDGLVSPPPAAIPVRVRPPQVPVRRRR